MLKIGVTGGIGSGKSVVCRIFSKYGVPVFRSDDVAKKLYNSNPIVKKKLINLLGPETYTSRGKLDRKYVASKIFSNKSLKKKVEAIVHPVVKKERKKKFTEWQRKGYKMAIVESALIFEAGLDKEMDIIVIVDANESVRIARIGKRDAISRDQVKLRLKNQINTNKNIKKADFVIYNNDSLKKLESKVRFLYNLFRQIISKEESERIFN